MRLTTLLLLAAMAVPFAGPASAQTGAQAGQAGDISPQDVLDAAVGDWNKDGREDIALLAVTPGDDMQVGLYVYVREEATNGSLLTLVLAVPDKIWGGRGGDTAAFGQEPSIKALANGSIAITTQNSAIGRNRWEHTISLAHRDGRFVVAGLTFNSYDTLQEEEPLSCDLNLLTGRGVVNERKISFAPIALQLQDWETQDGEDPGIRICRGR
ncbi:hypothetical protein [Stappia indica]|uniref:FG-GAP repeat-containing protein n=1 Tax=Stappia indica TaxID=538381 RepID=A0A857CA28_9HYPH|nr:hypothetical protein [Stappia indica]QGZ35883.1 hypothetical protein GH266_16130 [Stappia indica]